MTPDRQVLIRRSGRKPPEWFKTGPSTEDTCSFDFYLAGVIAEGVEMIAKRGIGYPTILNGQEEWTAILDEISLGFRNYCTADNGDRTPELERSLELLSTWWGALWD